MIHAFYGPIGQHGCTIGINSGGMKIMPIVVTRLLCGCGNRYEKLKTE